MIKFVIVFYFLLEISTADLPVVINTWKFSNATKKAWDVLHKGGAAKDALTSGCTTCEMDQCDFTVGFGGSPDENGETTLDAMIFDGTKMDMGAVGGLRRIKNAIGVARDVLERTKHSVLVGDLATQFAKQMGYREESLSTAYSQSLFWKWKDETCQPNYWKDVLPDPSQNCGPYDKTTDNDIDQPHTTPSSNSKNHDTIGMIVADGIGNVVAGTSSNGAKHKIPGRVGDAPLPGAGAYADSLVGGAAATGDGDIMMRFLPSFVAVEAMKNGATPTKAARAAIKRIAEKYPTFSGAVIALNSDGKYGAACNGMDSFTYCIANKANEEVLVKVIKCK